MLQASGSLFGHVGNLIHPPRQWGRPEPVSFKQISSNPSPLSCSPSLDSRRPGSVQGAKMGRCSFTFKDFTFR